MPFRRQRGTSDSRRPQYEAHPKCRVRSRSCVERGFRLPTGGGHRKALRSLHEEQNGFDHRRELRHREGNSARSRRSVWCHGEKGLNLSTWGLPRTCVAHNKLAVLKKTDRGVCIPRVGSLNAFSTPRCPSFRRAARWLLCLRQTI